MATQAIGQPFGQDYSGDKLEDFDDCISTDQVLLIIRNHAVLRSRNAKVSDGSLPPMRIRE